MYNDIKPSTKTSKTLWGIRNTATGLFYKNSSKCDNIIPSFFSSRETAMKRLNDICFFYLKNKLDHSNIKLFSLVFETKASAIVDDNILAEECEIAHIKYALLQQQINSPKIIDFIDVFNKKRILDKVQYIITFKGPDDPRYWFRFRRSSLKAKELKEFQNSIKNARQLLRNGGIKTRTYVEYRGVFGLLTEDQALLAKLTLEIKDFFNLSLLRTQIKITT